MEEFLVDATPCAHWSQLCVSSAIAHCVLASGLVAKMYGMSFAIVWVLSEGRSLRFWKCPGPLFHSLLVFSVAFSPSLPPRHTSCTCRILLPLSICRSSFCFTLRRYIQGKSCLTEGAVMLDASDRVDGRGYRRCSAIDCRSCFVILRSVFDCVASGIQGGIRS